MGPAGLVQLSGLAAAVVMLILGLLNLAKELATGGPRRRAETAATQAVSARDQAKAITLEHEIWFLEAREAYARADRESEECRDKLAGLDGRFHRLIDGLDDLCQISETGTVSVAELRTVVRAARYE